MYREIKKGVTRLTGSALQAWPVDSVYISFVNTNPASLFGGTWSAIGVGRMLVGVDAGDATMDAPGDTGGSKTTSLAVGNLPAHKHTLDVGGASPGTANAVVQRSSGTVQATISTPVGDTGSGTAFSNLPPYLAVYMWRRTS